MRQRQTILLTGFGPFPGMPENISGRLATELADLTQQRFPSLRVVARVLPTEWDLAPDRLEALYAHERPRVALHFGVSQRAQGLVIETLAQNMRSPLCDAAGCLPQSAKIVDDGPATLTARLPVEDILKRVTSLGIPATRSEDAGTYLCNAVLYRALTLVSTSDAPITAGFIHIPHMLGKQPDDRRLDNGVCPLGWDMALAGGLEIVRACLGREPSVRPARGPLLRDAG